MNWSLNCQDYLLEPLKYLKYLQNLQDLKKQMQQKYQLILRLLKMKNSNHLKQMTWKKHQISPDHWSSQLNLNFARKSHLG
jgi:ADP-heptose:LPS heptosyltransferase